MTLIMAVCTQFAQAQTVKLKMTNGTETVPDDGFLFYDSGGELLFDPVTDSLNASIYNKLTWYQHNEEYALTLQNPEGGGVRIEFEKILVNNDFLSFYEASDNSLIGTFCNNDYSTAFCSSSNTLIVESHGDMIVRFQSDYHWRDEGWEAKVYRTTATPPNTTAFTPRPPVAVVAACDNNMSLIPTSRGTSTTVLQFKIGSGSYQTYTEGSLVDLNEETFPVEVTVKATLDGTDSAEKTFTFKKITNPNAPTYTPQYSANKITTFFPAKPEGVNDTYYIRWTINNNPNSSAPENPLLWDASGHEFQQPSHSPHTVPAGDIDYTNVTLSTPFYVHFATRGTTCPNRFSDVVTVEITARYAPMPTISFETNSSTHEGATTLACTLDGATIYYTTDGSDPTTSSTAYNGSNFTVTAGTTVKAIAVKSGYTTSAVASAIFVPGAESGDPQSGTYGGVVLLDDREDHSWSYYSDGNQPIHSLKPADVKITYFGNGTNNMTTGDQNGDNPTAFGANATGVQVNVGETENQFIYLKTLENDDPEGTGNEYSYTLIPNPFQVRPVGEGGSSTITTYNKVTTAPSNWAGTYLLVYEGSSLAFNGSINNNYGGTTSVSINNGVINSPGNAVLLTIQQATTSGNTTYYYIKNGNNNLGYNNGYLTQGTSTNNNYQWYFSIRDGYVRVRNRNHTSFEFYYSNSGFGLSSQYYSNVSLYKQTTSTINTSQYRGFYAWRIKSLTSGLTIAGKNIGDIVYADEQISFVTDNAEGNEVEFEALWAQAYVTTCSSNNGLSSAIASNNLNANVGYERNFVVLTNGAQTDIINNTSQKPVTITQLYPDGSGTMSSSRFIGGNYTANNDTKFENIFLKNGGSPAYNYTYYDAINYNNYWYYINWNTNEITPNISGATQSSFVDVSLYNEGSYIDFGDGAVTVGSNSYTLYRYIYSRSSGATSTSTDYYAQGNDLVFGRGITPVTANGLCARNIYGYTRDSDATVNLAFRNRFESGSFYNLVSLYGNTVYTITGSANIHTTFGCDYDRAKKENSVLNLESFQQSYGINLTNTNSRYDIVVKSGTFTNSFYCGFGYITTSSGHIYGNKNRNVEVLGGDFSATDFVGGIDGYYNVLSDPNYDAIKIRIKGGTFGVLYPSGIHLEGYGNRHLIATGGTFTNWITGACNGTDSDGGITFGSSYLYFGGKATQTSTEGIYGSGYGSQEVYGTTNENSYYVTSSTVVIADEAQVAGSVYGGGNNGYALNGSDIYILGGNVAGNVYGGANKSKGATINITMKDGTVTGNIYGGSNEKGVISGLATINVTGGTVTNVFGGGYGSATNMAAGTRVNVNGGTINNVYGGGEEGTVAGNTNVSIGGGSIQNVFGAGKGATDQTALISGQTFVNVSGGSIDYVYGGGEAGNVVSSTNPASTVTIQGGTVNHDVFGGGRLGKTTGNVVVNMFGGNVSDNIYGGAFGKRNEVYIAGSHTVNMTGGNVFINVYGGSRNADDALNFSPTSKDFSATDPVNHINISGGHVYYHVFGGGYFGHTYGSVYTFIGQNAIANAPNAAPSSDVSYNAASLLIDGSVWAGADFGNFDGENFGEATIEGYSNIYIDGSGYNTVSTQPSDAGYMNIGGSVLGTGTSCYAGKLGSSLIFREYGQPVANPNSKDLIVEPYTTATRNLMSIQFFKDAVIDNTHLHLIGQGRINSLLSTEKYAVYDIKDVMRMANGSSFFIDFPVDQMKKLGSYSCGDVYAATPSYTTVGYGDLNSTDNKFRVNNGSYLNIKYVGAYNPEGQTGWDYGELEGFFHMMTQDENNTCAYARPKQSKDDGNQIPTGLDNPLDGGFLSYHTEYNTFSAGTLTNNAFANIADAPGSVTSGGVQMPYENHTLSSKNGEKYFRIWRYGGIFSYREGMFNAIANPEGSYATSDVVIALPANRGDGSYFRIKTVDGFAEIDYGSDLMTVNAGVYNSTNHIPATYGWMYYDTENHTFVEGNTESDMSSTALAPLTANPNVNFGLVAIPQGSLTPASSNNANWLICTDASDANEAFSTAKWYNNDLTINPSILFRLTYNEKLTNNATWDPIIIYFEQCDADGNVKDEIKVALSVTTNTTINQSFGTETFAMMTGNGSQGDTYTGKVVLPGYVPFLNTEGDFSDWTFKSAEWIPAEGTGTQFTNAWQKGSDYVSPTTPYHNDQFSMQIVPAANFDNSIGWNTYDHTVRDLKNLPANTHLAYTDGRNSTAFDFILHFDGRATSPETIYKMGTLKVTLHFTNISNGTDNHEQDLIINIDVLRRGRAANYYLDGVNGNNFFDGEYPNSPKKTLSGIFNRSNYIAGDNIFIVNTVTAEGATTLDWNGELYGKTTIYRYPGGHPLKEGNDPTQVYTDYDRENNKGFDGPLVVVKNGMHIHGIILDGAYDIAYGHPNTALAPTPDTYYQVPTAPLIKIESTGLLTVSADSKLQWNYANGDGGGVYNAGKMTLSNGSDIINNRVLDESYQGGGVYLAKDATLIVSDSVNIINNTRMVSNAAKANNVYLKDVKNWIQVGTVNPNDGINAFENHLNDGTNKKTGKVGVTKGDWGNDYFTPIAYSDGGTSYLENIIPEDPEEAHASDYLVFDDENYFRVVTLNNTPSYEPSSNYLFWVGTWATTVRTQPEGYSNDNINSAEDLAWAISVVNGLNTITTPQNSTNFNITADIDMSARIWEPIGTKDHPYLGTFNANGHNIRGIRSSLNEENMGMFGNLGNTTTGATIKDMVLNVSFTGGNSVKMGSVAAVMHNGTISNVEAAGVITGTASTESMGGLVANKQGGTIHSSFAVNTLTANNPDTYLGGLVGLNKGNLYNSYANATMSGSDRIGGLAGQNNGTIENCYAVVGSQTFPAFAYSNKGTIQYCYADQANNYVSSEVDDNVAPTGHSTYGAVQSDIKHIDYLYRDNLIAANTNTYVGGAGITYLNDNHTLVWNGLLSALNQWVKAKSTSDLTYTPWFRPTTTLINGDLPVLGFTSDNCLGTTDADGKYLRYGSSVGANGLDNLLDIFNNKVDNAASSLFLYGGADQVASVPKSSVKVFVNEDAALVQTNTAGDFTNTTVGVTFDNSWKKGTTWDALNETSTTLTYDWHFFSSPLEEASIGITYTDENGNWWNNHDNAQVQSVSGGYFPNGLESESTGWDIYTFYEPQYHWINLKRNSASHFHFDEPHAQINYTNETFFESGKGYMMAMEKDSYLSSNGTLNNKAITVNLDYASEQERELGCNLLGNPYQAYFDLDEFFAETNNAAAGINCAWVYIAEADKYAPYPTGASDNPLLPPSKLHPHQAFFVKASATGQHAHFDPSMATIDKDKYPHFRGGHVNYPLVNLFAYNEAGQSDFIVVEFHRPEIGGAPKMTANTNAPFSLTAQHGQDEYTILFTDQQVKRVPVRFRTTEDGTFTLKWDTYHGTFSKLLLIDNITGATCDMTTHDHYTFTGRADDYANRFYIAFGVTGVEEYDTDGEAGFAFFNGNDWVVTGKGQLQLIDVTGRILQSQYLSGENNHVNFGKVAAGVYMLRLGEQTQKIILR